MGLIESLRNYGRILRLSRKPRRSEFFLTIKIVVLGLGLLGGLGFLFQLIGSSLQFIEVPTIPRQISMVIIAATAAVILGVIMYSRRGRRG